MYSLALLAAVSFLVALILTPIVRDVFKKMGRVDVPDGGRKVHGAGIPRVGGVVIAVAYVNAFVVLFVLRTAGSQTVWHDLSVVERLAPAVTLIFAVGLLDDLYGLRPWWKFSGQLAAAGLAILGGLRITVVGPADLSSLWWSIPATLFWLVFCTNSFNLIDGVDGLATGVGLFATMTTLAAALMQGNFPLAMATVPLAGALLGFLRYNFNPASIFLGDAGSYSVGFLLGCFGIVWSQKAATLLGLTAPVMAFAVPLLDTGLSVVRRFLSGQPIFGADRGHIHHKLLDKGLTPRRAVMLLYGASSLFAVLALLGNSARNRFSGLVLVMFCVVAWAGIQSLGYVELETASRMLFRGAFRRTLHTELQLRAIRDQMEAASSTQERWDALVRSCAELGFSRVSLSIEGEYLTKHLNPADEVWTVTVPLQGGGQLELCHGFDRNGTVSLIAPLVAIVREAFPYRTVKKEAVEPEMGAKRTAGMSGFEDMIVPAALPDDLSHT